MFSKGMNGTGKKITYQLTFTCSKLIIKRCEKCSKLIRKHQNDVSDVVPVFLLLTLNIFYTFFLSIIEFEHVNFSCDNIYFSAAVRK